MSAQMDRLEAASDKAVRRVARAQIAVGKAARSVDAVTPGGRSGYDPAILSGIRRWPNAKADTRRYNAYDREAAAHRELYAATDSLQVAESRIAALAEREAAADLVVPADACLVRDSYGWHRVIRVNAKSVSVETGYSWTDRIPLANVLEARS